MNSRLGASALDERRVLLETVVIALAHALAVS